MLEKRQKFEHKKSLGQHFLNNARVPALMADAGDVVTGDTVLEVGPGTGMLTRELLARGAHTIALEADKRAVEILKETFKDEIVAKKLTILHTDARELDLLALGLHPRAYKVVANIPYYLSGLLFRTFLESDIQPSNLVFLVQKEVAERIARDKKESLLSLSVKVFGEPRYVKTVGKGNFTPPPKIDSAIIAISDISKDKLCISNLSRGTLESCVTNIPQEFFFKVLHEGFKSKRKQLFGNLSSKFPREVLINTFSTLNIPQNVRAEDVHLETWLLLIKSLTQKARM